MQSKDFGFILLVVGLDNSGKSTLIEAAKEEANKEKVILPTPGIRAGVLNHNNKKIVYYDLSGDGRHRKQWANYYSEIHGILFVVDASDTRRDDIVRDYIRQMFKDEVLAKREVPILVACNKQDLPEVRDKVALEEELGLPKLDKHSTIKYYVTNTSGFDNKGIKDALDWLTKNITVSLKKVKK